MDLTHRSARVGAVDVSLESPAPSDGTGMAWPSYDPAPLFDELVGPGGVPRPAAEPLWRHLARLGPEALAERQDAADREIRAILPRMPIESAGGVHSEGRR